MRNSRLKRNFTLVELLVSLGVFSILLILFMQFFSGMRIVWTQSDEQNEVWAKARVFMNMMSLMVNATYYSSASTFPGAEGQFPFSIEQPSSGNGKIYFATKNNTIGLPGDNSIRFIGIQLNTSNNNLYLTVLSNAEADYGRFMPEYLNSSGQEQSCSAALADLKSNLDTKFSNGGDHRLKMLSCVTEFQVRGYDANGIKITASTINSVPAEIEVQVSLMTRSDFRKWEEGGKTDAFKAQKQHTFTRRVYVGDNWKTEGGINYDQYP